MTSPGMYAKAMVAGLVALLGALAAGVTDGLTSAEWLTSAVAGLTAFEAVFWVRNAE